MIHSQQEQAMKHEMSVEATKGAIAAGGAAATAITLNEWVAIATLIYIALQIGLLLPKYYSFWKSRLNSYEEDTE